MTDRNRPADVGTGNWIDPPQNRWAFRHVRELTRTARIGRGRGPVADFPTATHDLGSVWFEHAGLGWTVDEMLAATSTDAFVVVHDGVLIADRYFDGMRPSDTHLLMSVSKSLTATLAGVLVERGLIDLAATVPDHVPELRGTAWDGCTVEHVLAMRTGTMFDEDDYDDPDSDGRLIEEISGYVPSTRSDLPTDTAALIRALANDRPHGGRFQYRSILTDVLAWVIESVTGDRFHHVFGREIWSRIGAEHDADIIVDRAGFPTAEGGICATARDLARFGLMVLDDGVAQGRRVVPSAWLGRLRDRDPDVIAAYGDAGGDDPSSPDACYRDMWWVADPTAGVFAASGINGQRMLIHHPSRTVIVKLSVWPERWDDDAFALTDAGLRAVCEHLT